MKTGVHSVFAVMCLSLILSGSSAGESGSWTGEIVGFKCKVEGSTRPAHDSCRNQCVKNGQPMGLLTDDGTLVLLKASRADRSPHEKLRSRVATRVEVFGSLAEKDGMKVVTVTGSKAAS